VRQALGAARAQPGRKLYELPGAAGKNQSAGGAEFLLRHSEQQNSRQRGAKVVAERVVLATLAEAGSLFQPSDQALRAVVLATRGPDAQGGAEHPLIHVRGQGRIAGAARDITPRHTRRWRDRQRMVLGVQTPASRRETGWMHACRR